MPMIAWVSASSARVVPGPPSAPGLGVPGSAAPSSWPVPAASAVELAEFGAQPDQVLQRAQVDIPGDHRGGRGVAGERRRGLAVEPGGPVAAGDRGGGAGRGPLRADPGRPLLQQRRAAVDQHQVGQRDVHQGPDRLAGPLGQQARGQQPPHRLQQRVVVPLGVAAGVLRPGRGAQRVQHRPHHRGALRRQLTGHHPGAAERGLQPDRAVLEGPGRVLVRQVRAGPLVHLRGQPGQVPQVHPRLGGRQQDRVRGRAAVLRQLVRPPADRPAVGFRQVPGGQRRHHLRVRHGARWPTRYAPPRRTLVTRVWWISHARGL